jgi:hypothetical protein
MVRIFFNKESWPEIEVKTGLLNLLDDEELSSSRGVAQERFLKNDMVWEPGSGDFLRERERESGEHSL